MLEEVLTENFAIGCLVGFLQNRPILAMAGEEWTTLSDFAVLPATSESRAALLAVVPLPRLLVLLSEGARMEVLCKCLEKILGSSDSDSRQILKSNDGARMLPLGLGHPDELVRRTSVQVVAGLVGCDEDIAWLQEKVPTLCILPVFDLADCLSSFVCPDVVCPCAHACTISLG